MKLVFTTGLLFFFCTAFIFAFTPKDNDDNSNLSSDDPCLTDNLAFHTNSMHWRLHTNNAGYTNGTAPFQYNGAVTTDWWWDSLYTGKWISAMSNPIHLSNGPQNESTTYRYELKCCAEDTIVLRCRVFRDNYCKVYIDGNAIFSDPIVNQTNQNTLQIGDSISYSFHVAANTTHNLDFEIIEAHVPGYPKNGWGGKMAGTFSSKSGINSIATGNPICPFACSPTALHKNTVDNLPGLTVYPNPTYTLCKIKGLPAGVHKFSLSNGSGQIVRTGTMAEGQNIDFSNLPAAVYYLSVSHELGIQRTQLIKQ
jgi:hypothetical protein